MMTKITVKGKYEGTNPRGIIVGGTHLINNGQVHTVLVDEQCYNSLVAGERSGWFRIASDNYEKFCISRMRPVPVVSRVEGFIENGVAYNGDGEPVGEVETVEIPVEETPVEEVVPPKKKSSAKKKD